MIDKMKTEDARKLLVLTSTFPRWRDDREPRFVELLSFELARHHDVTVLAPHCRGAKALESIESGGRTISVHRFRYFFAGLEVLAYHPQKRCIRLRIDIDACAIDNK